MDIDALRFSLWASAPRYSTDVCLCKRVLVCGVSAANALGACLMQARSAVSSPANATGLIDNQSS